jgi:hypothetical protein
MDEESLPSRYRSPRFMKKTILFRIGISLLAAGILYVGFQFFAPPLLAVFSGRARLTSSPEDWGYTYENIEIRKTGARANIWYLHHPNASAQIILLAHNGGNRSVPLLRWTAELLYSGGFSVALADPRGQGDTGGIKTYGFGEAVDVVAVIDELEVRYPELPIGGFGYSLGAATIIRVMGMDERLLAAAAFAPYSRFDSALLRQELIFQTNGTWDGDGLLLPLISAAFRMWAFSSRKIPEPIDAAVSLVNRKLLLMHFAGDPELPSAYSKEIIAAAGDNVQLELYDGNVHLPWRRTNAFEAYFETRVLEFFADALSMM